ncbi:MAG: serine/threonine-protein kinase, partial [Chloroflexota bacterium]
FTMSWLREPKTILEAGQDASIEQKIELIEQLLQGTAYLHRRGILHRDIKPGNVLVTNGVVRLLDFGLSQKIDDKGHMGGSAVYMAPELLDGYDATAQSDLYAIGVLFYQVMTGDHPYGAFNSGFYERLYSTDPDMTRVDERIRPLVLTLIAKKPEHRPSSAGEALGILADLLNQPLSPETEAIRNSYLQAAKFVGRKAEFAQLVSALDSARNGHGSGWLIGGKAVLVKLDSTVNLKFVPW